jgi:hypothetical protein
MGVLPFPASCRRKKKGPVREGTPSLSFFLKRAEATLHGFIFFLFFLLCGLSFASPKEVCAFLLFHLLLYGGKGVSSAT